jgi:hypothetical protein
MAVRFMLRFSPVEEPARWSSTYGAAYGLRGALLPLLRETACIDDLHGGRYCFAPDPEPDLEGCLVAYLSVGDDRRVEPFVAGLAAISDAAPIMRAGGVTFRLATAEVVAHVGPAELLAATPARGAQVRLMSITTFAAGDRRSRGVADPALIVRSWASSWNGQDGGPGPAAETGEPCPDDMVAGMGRLLDPIAGTLTWGRARVTVPGVSGARLRAPRSLYGFSGSFHLRLHRAAGEEHTVWLARLAALAPFVGTGYHVQLGLGITDVVAGSGGERIRRTT